MAQVWFKLGDMGFFSNRVFPTPGLGAPGGWLYKYPVHEVGGPPCNLSHFFAVILACITNLVFFGLRFSGIWAHL